MKHQKIFNLLNEACDSKFVTRKWSIVNDQSNANYDVGNKITYNKKVLKSNLCDCNDAYILARGSITIVNDNENQVIFKHCAPFTKCIIKMDRTTLDDAEVLDLVVPMFNLLKYISNCFDTTGILWFYSKDEATAFDADVENRDAFESFKCTAKLLEYKMNTQPAPG